MTQTQSDALDRLVSPSSGLSFLGLIVFVCGGSLLANLPADNPGFARTVGFVLVGLGGYALMAGAAALGVRLARANP